MSRRWLTAALVFVALTWILCAVLMAAAIVAEDYGRAGFNLALVLVNSASFIVIGRARADS